MNVIESNPLVSIAVATFNGAEFLEAQLETLINQTYTNLEIVICDDASTDSTHSIVEAYQKKDSRIKFFPNEENLGFNLNFERTLKHCTGEYIAISDQDDIWLLDKIEIILNAWEEGVTLVHHSTKTFESEPLPSNVVTNEIKGFSGNQLELLLFRNTVQGCTIVLRNDLLKQVFPFKKDVLYDWWIAINAANNGRVQFIHRNLIYHRRHSTSAFYSHVKMQTKLSEHEKHTAFLNYVLIRLSLNDKRRELCQDLISILSQRLTVKFSFRAFLFFLKNSHNFFSLKKKKFPYFSYLVYSYKNSFGNK